MKFLLLAWAFLLLRLELAIAQTSGSAYGENPNLTGNFVDLRNTAFGIT